MSAGGRHDDRYRSLAALLDQVVWTADATGAFVEPQSSWEAYTGQRWKDHRGFGWVDALHPEDRERVLAEWAPAIAGRNVWETQGRIWHGRARTWRWFVARATPLLDDGGAVREWIGTVADVEDQPRARMYQLFERAPALVAVFRTPDLVIEFVNEVVRRLSSRSLIGKRLQDVLTDARYAETVEEAVRTGRRSTGTEVAVVADWDGNGRPHERFFNFVNEPTPAEGVPTSIMTFGYDVTDQVVARKRVEDAARALEATGRAKDEFLATVSHELRTPLSSILGWSSLLAERPTEPELVAKAADVIRRNAKAQAKLVEDILDVSRIVSGKLRIEAQPVSIEAVVRDALEVVRPPAVAKDIDLALESDADVTVVGDEDRLRQVVWNLLSNAIKFTDAGGRVTVRTRRAPDAVTIEVEDTGRGISAEFLPHVFERFRQADSSTTRSHGGLGLGLAIVRHLVELHGGQVSVHSDGEARGATFAVTLPVRAVFAGLLSTITPSETEIVSAAPSSPKLERARPASLDGLRVLVLDDETDAREMIAAALASWGAEVTTADAVPVALEAIARDKPDVVVSDIGMPKEDGYSFVRRLRASGGDMARLPAVALTAYARSSDAERAIASGFDLHVTKPVDPDDLREVIAKAARGTLSGPSRSGTR